MRVLRVNLHVCRSIQKATTCQSLGSIPDQQPKLDECCVTYTLCLITSVQKYRDLMHQLICFINHIWSTGHKDVSPVQVVYLGWFCTCGLHILGNLSETSLTLGDAPPVRSNLYILAFCMHLKSVHMPEHGQLLHPGIWHGPSLGTGLLRFLIYSSVTSLWSKFDKNWTFWFANVFVYIIGYFNDC